MFWRGKAFCFLINCKPNSGFFELGNAGMGEAFGQPGQSCPKGPAQLDGPGQSEEWDKRTHTRLRQEHWGFAYLAAMPVELRETVWARTRGQGYAVIMILAFKPPESNRGNRSEEDVQVLNVSERMGQGAQSYKSVSMLLLPDRVGKQFMT
ncbi:hypothetical protein DUI87_22284 [Hirundo rustica rustica]|uniref:Uncharacterized protein n=1 Tax=Hirundo rustica rustica TaxID=333673 RepID=A0A3M0JJ91_HIRRU|nr:hypothetical protein DUI87_22284 [Hirundo rustica rustica]